MRLAVDRLQTPTGTKCASRSSPIAAAVAVVGVLSMGALTPSADAASYWGGTSSTSRYSPLLGSTQTTWSNGMSATSRYSPLLGSTQTTYSGYGYGG